VLCFLSTFAGSEGLSMLPERVASQVSRSASVQRGNAHSPEKMDFMFSQNKRKRLAPTLVEQNVVCFAKQQLFVLGPVSMLLEMSFFLHFCMLI